MAKINKRKNTGGLLVANGISVAGDIKLYTDKPHNSRTFLLIRWLMAFICTLSTVLIADNFVGTDVGFISIIFFSLLSTVMFSMVKSESKIIGISGFVCAAAIMLILLVHKDDIINGFFIYAHKYLTHANQPSTYFGAVADDLRYWEYSSALSYFFLALSALTGFGAAAGCVYRTDFCILFIFTFPILELGLYWGWKPLMPACIALIICWVIILAMNIVNHTTNKAGRKNTFAIYRRKKIFYFTSLSGKAAFNGVYTRFTALICAAVFTAVILFSAVTGFVRPDIFNYYRRTISKAAANITIDSIINSTNGDDENVGEGRGWLGVKSVGGTNGGILGETNGISFNNSTTLKITMPRFSYPMYLKGYSGGEYKDNSWSAIEINTNKDYYKKFRDDGYYPQDITNINLKASTQNSALNLPEQEIQVTVKGASKQFAYSPYGTDFSGSNKDKFMKMCEESYMIPDKKEYSLTYLNLDSIFKESNDWRYVPVTIAAQGNIRDSYPEYTNFVNEKYLKYPDSDALNKAYETIVNNYLLTDKNAYGYNRKKDASVYSYSSVYGAIKAYFQDNFKYTLNPGATPDGEDFIDYFLTEQKEGYCSYFATTATELLRMFGFPARYAEGYIVLPSQYHDGEIEVKDTAAHAWTEVYFEGIGWIPAEFTPGYDNDNPNLSNTGDDSSSSKPDSSSAVTSSSSQTSSTTASSSSQTQTSKTDSSSSQTNSEDTSVTSEGGGTGGSSAGSGGENTNGGKSYPPLWVMLFGGVLISGVSVILIRRGILLTKKKREIYQSSHYKGVKAIYRYTLKLIELTDISVDRELTDKQLFDSIIRQCGEKNIHIDKKQLHTIFENAVKAHMSSELISKEDFTNSEKAMELITEKTILPALNAYKKLYAMFIKCLF